MNDILQIIGEIWKMLLLEISKNIVNSYTQCTYLLPVYKI